jgi:CDP-paratose 2-epimerase
MSNVLVTGSAGLIGSAVAARFTASGWNVIGVDNNMRAKFFGAEGWPVGRALDYDVRDRPAIDELFWIHKPNAIVHCAGQPSHDWAASDPLTDFDINARGTLVLLEAARKHCPEAPFVFLSTNKVYGDGPNELERIETETRFEFVSEFHAAHGISERFPLDARTYTIRSLFGCSKLAADTYVREYSNYFGMRTACLRCGCITGAGHAAVPQHGFLSYLVKCALTGETYTIHGGKQVRDNLAATDLAALIELIVADLKPGGAVYNVGGGKANSVSILEVIDMVEEMTGKRMRIEFDPKPRKGDHVVYYSDLRRVRADYPTWQITKDVPAILAELVDDWRTRLRLCVGNRGVETGNRGVGNRS